jgi:hypothetical protein
MPYDIHQEKEYSQNSRSVYDAALKSVEKLSGKILSSSPSDLKVEVKFDKTILGKVLGDRTQLTCRVRIEGDGSKVVIDAYPLDAVGRKLMFGARKGVTQAVIDLFLTYLEHNLN